MDEKWIEQIHANMEQKSTEELRQIWKENDREEWSDEAFIAIRRILEARGENPGPQAQAISADEPAQVTPRERPGCVTATVLFLGMGAAAAVIRVILTVLVMSEGYGNTTESLLVGIVTSGIVASLYLLLARGLWQLKNWARIVFIVLQSLSMLVLIVLPFSGVGSIFGVIGLAIGGYSIYWFAAHGEYFDRASSSELPHPTHPTEAVVPAKTASPAMITLPASAAVNQLGFWSALLTTASATLLSVGPWVLMLVVPAQQVVPPGIRSFLDVLAAGLSLLEVFGFVILMACIAKSAPPAKIVWPWLGLVFAVLAAGCVCLQVSPLTQFGSDFRRLAFPSLAGPDESLFWNAVFIGLAGLCALPVFRAGRIEQFIRQGLLVYAGAILLTSINVALSVHSPLALIRMIAQMVIFPLTIGLITVVFRRAQTMPRLSQEIG